MKRKHLLLLSATLCLTYLPSAAQSQPEAKRNVLRVGAGTTMLYENSRFGILGNVEYGYIFNNYLELSLMAAYSYIPNTEQLGEIADENNKYKSHMHIGCISPRLIVTPFAKRFRFVKIGVGIFYESGRTKLTHDISLPDFSDRIVSNRKHSYGGVDLCGRIYVIDNAKYELFCSYQHRYIINSHNIYNAHMQLGLNFGIKF